jgi:polyhydroxyalkanoate synthesis regulator phasin
MSGEEALAMPEQKRTPTDPEKTPQRRLAEGVLARTLDPFGVVMLTRERIQETLEEAVARGRVTRSDANELAGELLRRGRVQTEELLGEVQRLLESGRDRLESGGTPLGESLTLLARTAERARRGVAGDGLPIADYDHLTARQVQAELSGLTAAQLTAVRDYERRHANRKTVLDAIDRASR